MLEQLVKQDLINNFLMYFSGNIRIAFVITLVMIVVGILFRYVRVKLGRTKSPVSLFRVVILFVFVFYLCYVVEITFFCREPGSREGLDLHFLDTFYWENPYSMSYVVENLLLFLPFGVLFPMLHRHFCWIVVPVVLLCSLSIETGQLLTSRGYFQVDDIWLNVAGAVIGLIVYLFGCLGKRLMTRNK